MSKFDEFDNGDMMNMNDNYNAPTAKLELTEELEEQLASLRKKDKLKMIVFGFAAGLMVAVGAGLYVAQANADSDPYSYGAGVGYQTGSGSGASGTYTDYSQAYSAGGAAGGGGSCCGGGAGGASGSAGSASLADLEKQALAQYKQEKGAETDVTAKAQDFGCHTQIDIKDKTGKVVRSYGFQGSSLYVIK